ncbi:MAG: hypothetical protein JWO18_2031 [Microbacteriaceae bacterium]|nr:hypothetical protein [Microbacteriaceae bacterium]
MPYPLGGDRYKAGPWYPAPGIEPLSLEERLRGPVRPPVAPVQPAETLKLEWVASEFRGPFTLTVRGVTFHLPVDAKVKRRPPLVWVLVDGLVHVLSERGDLLLSAVDRVRFARLWENL